MSTKINLDENFMDVSHELYREYIYSNGATLTIKSPLRMRVLPNNSHIVFDGKKFWWVAPGYISIRWEEREEEEGD